jgi:glutamate dehydrogenase
MLSTETVGKLHHLPVVPRTSRGTTGGGGCMQQRASTTVKGNNIYSKLTHSTISVKMKYHPYNMKKGCHMAMESAWYAALEKKLIKQFGAKKGAALVNKYKNAFHPNYCETNTVEIVTNDIEHLEKLSSEHPFEIDFYEATDTNGPSLELKIFQYDSTIPLSDIVPMLENMDLRALNERSQKINLDAKTKIWITNFSILYKRNTVIDISQVKEIFQDALTQIRFGICENDGFNKLVLGASLSWRKITILRAYAKYLQQVGFRFSQAYIENTLASYPNIVRELVELFELKNAIKSKATDLKKLTELENNLQTNLEAVTSLDDDRILRRLLSLINVTLRTNYFQFKDYIAFKLDSQKVPELPLPHPLYEIFIYSPRFEGVHLRGAKVARGGIRWSERREDFRTEVLGLMKAQRVKNAVIVPSGAKGGFVLKMLPPQPTREIMQKEVVTCYKSFISGLLDLTDNIINGKTIRPKDVTCHDDFDPYLVVAADKGTATFSDVANSISKEYNFWLGDAFASGGSAGYDHKKMGITARGAWESIKRHFQELKINIHEHEFTVAGIGDMSGDVFGNGLLYSKKIKLVGAFDHRHIFLDPNPNPIKSFAERERLFNLPTSSWEDYNAKLISTGGGVYKRSLKSIPISAEMRKVLDIQATSLPPNELICALLKAPVDLLYNGGIGTYVKASTESNADVGDKTNDYCRVNGEDLRCKIVGEGGNLGFTQLSRVEFALLGGLINTDFIDNSGGVDCSDHEVNVKILLNTDTSEKKLAENSRNQLLAKMTDEIGHLVLKDNYNQALALSFSALTTANQISLYQSYIKELETVGGLDRVVEFLPDDKKLLDRKASGLGMTRPELAVLLAYTKIYIKQEILKSDLPEDVYVKTIVATAFPSALQKSFGPAMAKHRLHREIIATQLSNKIVNEMGITFVYQLQVENGATVAEIIRAYLIASNAFRTLELQKLIESLDFKVPVTLQYELLQHIYHLMILATRWFLRGNRAKNNLHTIIDSYAKDIKVLEDIIPKLMLGSTKAYLDSLAEQFVKAGLSETLANRIAVSRALYTTLNIIEVSKQNRLDLIKAAKVYFAVGGRFNLVWFRDQIANDTREGHWNIFARLTLRDELDVLQKQLTVVIILANKKETDINKLIEHWASKNFRTMERWDKILELLHGSTSVEYSMFFIALRELSNLISLETTIQPA